MIAGFPLPQQYVDAFKKCENSKEAVALLEHYTAENYAMTASFSNPKSGYICQQCCITYLDDETQKFCSYIVSCTNDQRNIDIKTSIPNQIVYRCIGSENDELTALFQLRGVRQKMQQFSATNKGADDIFEIIEVTQKMYDIIHLVDNDASLKYRTKYWVIDRDSMQFQQMQYHPTYSMPIKNSTQQELIKDTNGSQNRQTQVYEFNLGAA